MAIKLNIQVEDQDNGGYKLMEVDAEMLKETIGGKPHFVHASTMFGEDWIISEYESGGRAGWGRSIKNAIGRAESNINGVGQQKYTCMIEDTIRLYGKANTEAVPPPSNKLYDEIEVELKALIPEEEEEEYDECG